jgi:hypothetical protein
MSKFQPPMLNDDACRVSTDKQTHKHTHTHTYKKHTYWVKTEETFFYRQVFYILFFFCNSLKVKKRRFPKTSIPPSCSGNRRPQTKRTLYTLDESWSHGIIILRYTIISNQYVELVNSINIMSHRTHFWRHQITSSVSKRKNMIKWSLNCY